ncbi:alkylation response protein AidB-like acyl-CoA dehydrogenase [Bradyrhizobium sp. R2.2-H]|jgi:alkylation response protein AidB-like acyl-CoA dehydrogenase|uniref:acyl-CoA dehydrogenase family protein n=1 Tax=unclassified Bradyrhizobium TaxID=2631580 RepID=UPI001051AF8C|nr:MULTISPECIES: acyl-CoA dehydrogenase family protein [unclassified Bradyrhizobium]TCU64345.1 alkylation response protein AidB-like acyl-CoA dehydrogenase [Bradyrhizobium sp. Y-H1]TCU66271.1 alkylation response protein AidB-like acyl-CoA dehydrogenase [Bradyrhizobium sp. R2.2-H]
MSLSMQRAARPSTTPSVAEFHARLDAVLPLVESRAAEAEAQGYLTDDVVAALRKAGIYTMLFPREVGGAELLPYDAMTVIERLAYTHASAGWCAIGNNMEGTTLAIYVEDEGIKKVFAKGADITIAGNGVPRGFARPVDGGYMIRGNWAYGSGIQHAEWVHSGCFVTDASGKDMVFGPNGQPKIVVTHHPRATIKLMGNWDVLGLRATGSFDYTLSEGDELFVPTHMTYDFDIGAPRRGGVQGALGLAGYSAWAHSSWAVGVGRRMLDELVKVIVPRQDPFGKSCESASFKFQFAQAEARFRAARALVHETWKEVSETCACGESPSLAQMTMIKLSLRHIHDVLSDVSTFAHRAARGASLHNTPMQRFYRDIHSGTQHILMADQIVEECGRALLGLPGPGAQWTVFGVTG